ncbi:MAG: Salicola phage CGphi29, partial [Pseudomonadota bacterium]
MNLRLYQRQAIDSLMDWFRANPTGNPMLVLPTGAGKSVVLAMLIREALEQWPATRVLLLTHVKELIQQNAAKMLSVWPQAPLGIYSAGLGRRDTYRQIIFAGIQSVHNKAMHLGAFDLIIIDECHL